MLNQVGIDRPMKMRETSRVQDKKPIDNNELDAHNGIGSNAEAILPISQLPKVLGLDKMQDNNNGPIIVKTVLDGKVIAETIASYSDIVSGNRMNLAERGLAL